MVHPFKSAEHLKTSSSDLNAYFLNASKQLLSKINEEESYKNLLTHSKYRRIVKSISDEIKNSQTDSTILTIGVFLRVLYFADHLTHRTTTEGTLFDTSSSEKIIKLFSDLGTTFPFGGNIREFSSDKVKEPWMISTAHTISAIEALYRKSQEQRKNSEANPLEEFLKVKESFPQLKNIPIICTGAKHIGLTTLVYALLQEDSFSLIGAPSSITKAHGIDFSPLFFSFHDLAHGYAFNSIAVEKIAQAAEDLQNEIKEKNPSISSDQAKDQAQEKILERFKNLKKNLLKVLTSLALKIKKPSANSSDSEKSEFRAAKLRYNKVLSMVFLLLHEDYARFHLVVSEDDPKKQIEMFFESHISENTHQQTEITVEEISYIDELHFDPRTKLPSCVASDAEFSLNNEELQKLLLHPTESPYFSSAEDPEKSPKLLSDIVAEELSSGSSPEWSKSSIDKSLAHLGRYKINIVFSNGKKYFVNVATINFHLQNIEDNNRLLGLIDQKVEEPQYNDTESAESARKKALLYYAKIKSNELKSMQEAKEIIFGILDRLS